jgi:cytochrome c oxidase subunit I+III
MKPLSPIALHRSLDAAWRTPGGLGRLSAVNHTIVGRRFIVTAFVFFGIGGVLAMLLRIQLATSESVFVGPEIYNQLFTMHGTLMMFLFAIPMIEGMAIYLIPKLVGARDMAFPRLSAFGYWCYLFGATMLVLSLVAGVAPDGGWFLYTPLSSRTYTPGINADFWLIGVTFVEVSAIAAAVEIVVSILKVRTGGMAIHLMPLMAWYLLVTAFMMLGGFPPLILGSILLEIERAFAWPFFDPTRGGDPLLWQHLFWLFGHPEVYIIFLPAAGAISMIIPVFARRPIVGYTWIVCAIVALAFLSFGLWVHHMYTVGLPHMAIAFFSAASMLVAVPTGVQIFAWLATLITGRPELKLPMLYILGFFFVFVPGGLTGVMVAVAPFDWQVHDTHFVVAHLHYVLVGGFVFPILAAAYYWLPQMTGRMPIYHLGKIAFWLIFIGFHGTFLLMHLTGLHGMPRRIYTYRPEFGWDFLNLVSSFGAFIMAAGFATFTVDMILQMKFGKRFRRNPWKAGTLEWAMPTPPTTYNFASLPKVSDRDPLYAELTLPADLAGGRGYLARVSERKMETLGVDMVTGKPDQIVDLPTVDFKPLWTALAAGLFFVSALSGLYWLCVIGAVSVTGLAVAWAWPRGLKRDPEPEDIGYGETATVHYVVPSQPAWWGLVFTLLADGFLFGSLVFGYLFLWTVAPNWPPPAMIDAGAVEIVALFAGLVLAAGFAWLGRAAVSERNAHRTAQVWLSASAATGLVTIAAAGWSIAVSVPPPVEHAYGAATAALLWYVVIHAAIGVVFAVYGLARCRAGFVSARRSLDVRGPAVWQAYTAATGLIALVLVHLLPAAAR